MRCVSVPGLPPFTGGVVGSLSYDSVRGLERLPASARDDLGNAGRRRRLLRHRGRLRPPPAASRHRREPRPGARGPHRARGARPGGTAHPGDLRAARRACPRRRALSPRRLARPLERPRASQPRGSGVRRAGPRRRKRRSRAGRSSRSSCRDVSSGDSPGILSRSTGPCGRSIPRRIISTCARGSGRSPALRPRCSCASATDASRPGRSPGPDRAARRTPRTTGSRAS
jgi:hypothetical protein